MMVVNCNTLLDVLIDKLSKISWYKFKKKQFEVKKLKSENNLTVEVTIKDLPKSFSVPFPEKIIVKQYLRKKQTRKEIEVQTLTEAVYKGITVPKIIFYFGNFLVMEKVSGYSVNDLINDFEGSKLKEKEMIIKKLGHWMGDFHYLMALKESWFCKGNPILRKFLYDGENIIGLDFEESKIDDPLKDISTIVASILITEPGIYTQEIEAIDWKFNLSQIFLVEYFYRLKARGRSYEHDAKKLTDSIMDMVQCYSTGHNKEMPYTKLNSVKERLFSTLEQAFG
ncbi:MAG: hypothetical protein ACFFCS_08515 [Candidatus Hodarchaeota archaeon]